MKTNVMPESKVMQTKIFIINMSISNLTVTHLKQLNSTQQRVKDAGA